MSNFYISDKGIILTTREKRINKEANIVGSIMVNGGREAHKAYFWELDIDEKFRRKGFGKKLRSHAIQFCKRIGKTEIDTSAHSDTDSFSNEDLIEFYKRNFMENGATNVEHIGKYRLIAHI